jgi:signal transduction histidine kinase
VGVGTGLGLSVSYGIVENMGGRLSVRNSTEGARFCIELPIVPPTL